MNYPPVYAFNSRKCNICIQQGIFKPTTVKQCTKCKLISYCGVEHQKKDYKRHKPFCEEIYDISQEKYVFDKNESLKGSSDQLFVDKKIWLGAYMTTKLNRELTYHERSMIDFPKICSICREFDPKKLTDCLKCKGVSYCSDNHKHLDTTNHSQICDFLKIIYTFRIEFETSSKLVINSSIIPKTFPSNLLEMLQTFTTQTLREIPTTQAEFNRLSELSQISCAATILYGLEILDLRTKSMKSLIVHIVGSSEKELNDFNENLKNIFASFLPKVEILNLIFIGPELPQNLHHSWHHENLKINLLFKKGFYHEIIPCFQETPDLIISFNCGFAEFEKSGNNTWWKSIDSIIDFVNVPLVFTSYTKKESHFDMEVVRKRCEAKDADWKEMFGEFGKRNPFRDFRPMRNWDSVDDEAVYFANGVIQIIRFTPKVMVV